MRRCTTKFHLLGRCLKIPAPPPPPPLPWGNQKKIHSPWLEMPTMPKLASQIVGSHDLAKWPIRSSSVQPQASRQLPAPSSPRSPAVKWTARAGSAWGPPSQCLAEGTTSAFNTGHEYVVLHYENHHLISCPAVGHDPTFSYFRKPEPPRKPSEAHAEEGRQQAVHEHGSGQRASDAPLPQVGSQHVSKGTKGTWGNAVIAWVFHLRGKNPSFQSWKLTGGCCRVNRFDSWWDQK